MYKNSIVSINVLLFTSGQVLMIAEGIVTADQLAVPVCSPSNHGRFGTAAAILDFNRDGVMDVGRRIQK
jgi:hypothetical protein